MRKTGDVVRRQRRLVDLLLESREFEIMIFFGNILFTDYNSI
ncbi:MAG: hypothetical protein ACOC35_16910 [Promethearchaeia archaeon]